MRIKRPTTRAAFTLVEMLVAMALILMIMSIMAQAFASGSKVFRDLRSIGEMQEKLRGSITILRRDLANDHFGPPYGPNRGGPHLGDQRLDQAGWTPPYAGYFEMSQGLLATYEPAVNPVTDGEGLFSTRNTTCMMRFTIRLPDGPATELYSAAYHPRLASHPDLNAFPGLAPMVYSRWAEVCYFLVPRGTTNGGLPFYSLHRRVRLLPPKTVSYLLTSAEYTQIVNDIATGKYPDMIDPILTPAPAPPFPPGSWFATVPGPEMINTDRNLRIPPVPHPTGDDVLMTDTLSFEVKAAWFNNPMFEALVPGSSPPGAVMPLNSDEPFSNIPVSTLNPILKPMAYANAVPPYGFIFDTWFQNPFTDGIDWESPITFNPPYAGFLINTVPPVPGGPVGPLPPLRINVRALQIKLRTWNPRTEQARQASVVQDL